MTNTVISKDLANKKLNVTRQFKAPVDKVWKAWTEAELLDKWWAPRPWKAVTKTMDFKEGGAWLYSMVGPNGESSYCRVGFISISPKTSFTVDNGFSDEHGNINTDFPTMHWLVEFKPTTEGSKVEVTIIFDSETDLEKIVGMGFEAGFSMGLGNLDELLLEI